MLAMRSSTPETRTFREMTLAWTLSNNIENSISGEDLQVFEKHKRAAEDDLTEFESPTKKILKSADVVQGLERSERYLENIQQMCRAAVKGYDKLLENDPNNARTRKLKEDILRHMRSVIESSTYLKRNSPDIFEDAFQKVSGSATKTLCLDFFNSVYEAIRAGSSDDGPKSFNGNATPQERSWFAYEAHEAYESQTTRKKGKRVYTCKWCVVVGDWITTSVDENAMGHVIPHCFKGVDLAYLFGVGKSSTAGPENAIPLWKPIEQAFDQQKITFFPTATGSFDGVPDYKLIVLDHDLFDEEVPVGDYRDLNGQLRSVYWKDVSDKVLKWNNDRRPARRFLYLRHLIALTYSMRMGHMKSWEHKVPNGTIWASPGRPQGYLRHSALIAIGGILGDKLPKEYITDGLAFRESYMFPSSEHGDNAVGTQWAKIFQELGFPGFYEEDDDVDDA